MLVKKYRSEVISIVNPFREIYSVGFRSLNGKYRYHPGQFLHLAIDSYDGTGQWPESRCFSIRSSPNDNTLEITYSVKGRFTNQMEQLLHMGSEVWLKLPYGNLFTQDHNKTNTVFIAGGTGITPFLSLFTHSSFNEYKNPKFYFGFRSKEYNIYNEELSRLCNSSKCITYFYEDIDGVIDIKSILKENSISQDYFLSGPPQMIDAFKKFLITNGLPESQIFSDRWE